MLFNSRLKKVQSERQSKPKKLLFQDSGKMRAFNKIVLENLNLIIYSPKFESDFAGKGITLTKVT